jgi:AcrR family transcriptional regulator
MAIDRRVTRTRNALYDALVTLILRKGYDVITVQDLLQEADVGRSTFYAHFTSKEDLLVRSLDRVRAILTEAVAEFEDHPTGRPAWSLTLFNHVAEYRAVYAALAGIEAGEVLRNAIRQVIVGFVAGRIGPVPGLSTELLAECTASLFMTLLTWWLDRRPDLSPAEVDALFARLLAQPLRLR